MVSLLRWIFRLCFYLIFGLFLTTPCPLWADEEVPTSPPHRETSIPADSRPVTIYEKLGQYLTATVALSAAVRLDQLRWNIAGNMDGTPPNILSELDWSDILSHQLSLSGHGTVMDTIYLRGHLNYAWVQSGTVRDSDYAGDNRTDEWSQSISTTNGDELWDLVAGAGYPFRFQNRRFVVAPMVGFSVHKQNLRITRGRQTVSGTPPPGVDPPPPVGPFASPLNSLYEAKWTGLWTGCDLRYQLAPMPGGEPPMTWRLSLAYHFLGDYSAEADWNLRVDLQHPVSFEHDADSNGISLEADWCIRLASNLTINFAFNYIRWSADNGTHRVYVNDGTIQTTRINEIIWESHSISGGIAYRFF